MAWLVWDFWKAFAEKIGHYQTAAILTLIYWLVVGPIWLVGRLTGHRFFPSQNAKAMSLWHLASMGQEMVKDMEEQG